MFVIPAGRRSPRLEVVGFNRLNRMMSEAFGNAPALSGNGSLLPATDIVEDENAVTMNLELPGVRLQDVKLSFENGTLTVRATKERETTEKTEQQRTRLERTFGQFERRFSVPNTIESEKIEASMKDGVLTVVLPKSERSRSRQIEVKG